MKAVIMAGGEGKRLRPLTCTVPKPMAKILGKPVIEYIFDLLLLNGVTDAAVTLGYMPHIIEKAYESGYKNMKLNFIREDEPLGTAGSVKNAAADFKEPFVVISGDALCDFDLEKIMTYHKAAGAMITVVAVDAGDPREYGIINTDRENRIVGFVEKPSWSQALSSLANTGVYIINPECLELIPKGKPYDFAKDLFPMMLERDMPIFCYHTSDYWCDIGNIESYLKCNRDAFDGKFKAPVSCIADGIFVKKSMPKGDYSVIPPVYIGENAEISDGAVIGPYAVVDDGCYLGRNSAVRYSAVLENSWLADKAKVTGAVVCSGAALKKGASMFEGSVAGSGSVVGEFAGVKPGVLVWPGKIVPSQTVLDTNLKYGSMKSEYIGENGITESGGVRLNAETCVRFGAAMGSNAGKIGIASDGKRSSEIMRYAVMSGIAGSGGSVTDFGESFKAQLDFLVNFCGLDAGVFIKGGDEKSIEICGKGGLPITRSFERLLENAMSKCEFREASEREINEIAEMHSVKNIYVQELMKQAKGGLNGVCASFECENESIKSIITDCAARLGVTQSDSLVLRISPDGSHVTALSEGEGCGYETLLSVCCLHEMKKGNDISVPYDAPSFLDELTNGRCRVMRYLSTPADDSDSAARSLAEKQVFVRDGLFLSLKLLSVMKERGKSLSELADEIPKKYIFRKTVSLSFSPSFISKLVGEDEKNYRNTREGIKLVRQEGSLLIIPEKSGKSVRILAEADTAETAEELCGSIEDLLNSDGC